MNILLDVNGLAGQDARAHQELWDHFNFLRIFQPLHQKDLLLKMVKYIY